MAFTCFLAMTTVFIPDTLALAQTDAGPPAAKVLHLRDLVQDALTHNQLLKAKEQEVQSLEARIGPAGAYADPMLSVEAMNYPVDTFSSNQSDMTGNKISLTQAIPFPGKQSRLRQAAAFASQAEKEEWNQARLEVIRDVKISFFQYFLGHQKKRILEDKQRVIRQLIVATRDQYMIGKVPQAEVLNFQVEEANLIEQILIVENEIAERIGDLHHLLGRKSKGEVLGTPEEIQKTSIDFSTFSHDRLTEIALQKNPAVRARDYQANAALSRASYANWNYLPDLELGIGYTFREGTPMSSSVDFISGMVGISLPVWAMTKQSNEVRSAQAQQVKARALAEQERIHLAHQVHNLYVGLQTANGRVQLFESGVLPLVRQAVLVGKSAYLARKLDYSSLLTAINNRFHAEISYYDAWVSYESKIAELEALVGGPLVEQNP